MGRKPRRITVGEITRVVAALDPAEPLTESESASDLGRKVVRPLWAELQQRMMEELDKRTIEDLCLSANSAGVESEARQRLDFTI